ncbi:MAG: SseB family protein [Actinomycetota bacterium]|nr:SseB family protein [Actinomycetota bacterium]
MSEPTERGRFAGHDPAGGHDTAGVGWAGRTLTATGFEDDRGAADEALRDALADPDQEGQLVAAVSQARLLVPVVAVPGEAEERDGHSTQGDGGLGSQVDSAMAVATLTAPDGTRALPAFTSLERLRSWDPACRPVPVTAQRAARAAVQEGCQVIVLDPSGPQRPATGGAIGSATRTATGSATGAGSVTEQATDHVLRGSMVWALATGREWVPAHRDPQVAAAVAAAVGEEPRVLGHDLTGSPGGGLGIVLTVAPGLGPTHLEALVARIGRRIAADGQVRARIDAVDFRVRPPRA